MLIYFHTHQVALDPGSLRNVACMHAKDIHKLWIPVSGASIDAAWSTYVRLVDDDADPDPDPDPAAAAVTRERAFLHMIMKQLQL
jgi:hypothetical protein